MFIPDRGRPLIDVMQAVENIIPDEFIVRDEVTKKDRVVKKSVIAKGIADIRKLYYGANTNGTTTRREEFQRLLIDTLPRFRIDAEEWVIEVFRVAGGSVDYKKYLPKETVAQTPSRAPAELALA